MELVLTQNSAPGSQRIVQCAIPSHTLYLEMLFYIYWKKLITFQKCFQFIASFDLSYSFWCTGKNKNTFAKGYIPYVMSIVQCLSNSR